jgi:hypothetical protein
MRIKQHDKSYIVELEDRSKWRIWPGDIAVTLQWLPTADIVMHARPYQPNRRFTACAQSKPARIGLLPRFDDR